MGHKPSDETQSIQKKNKEAFKKWINNSGKSVFPIPKKSVIYAGFPESELRRMRKDVLAESELEGIWTQIVKAEKDIREFTGIVEYDMLSNVLKRITKHLPKLHEAVGANIGHPKKYANMYDCASALASNDWQLLDRGMRTAVWQALSKLYVMNADANIQIWEGRKKNYKTLDRGSTLINTELHELLKKKDLKPATRKKAEEMAKRHRDFHDMENKKLDDLFKISKKDLLKKAKK